MYKILVNNDDGIDAIGIKALVKYLGTMAEVYVVAPKEQQSGKGQSLTFRHPVTVDEVEMEGATKAYALAGAPTDCAKWGISILGKEHDFDFLFSGINLGANIGTASFYSGTCGAAFEGAMNGIHSIALSVNSHEASNFEYACSMIPELMEMSMRLDPSTVISVNTPDLPPWKIKGVKVTEPAPHVYGDCYYFKHKEGNEYQMIGTHTERDDSLDNDYNWVMSDYASITTLSTALNDQNALRRVRGYMIEKAMCVFIGAQEENASLIKKPKRFGKNLAKWSKCVDRLDMPVLIAEHHGKGAVLPQVIKHVKNYETVDVAEFDALANNGFGSYADAATEKRVYIAGLETHVGVMQTALSFIEKGFDVTIIEDCCAAHEKHDHEQAIKNLRKAGCHIRTYESAAMEIIGSSRHDAYNSIDSIINKG